MKTYFLTFLLIFATFASCSKKDDPIVEDDDTKDDTEVPTDSVDITVQNFLWQTMNAYYYWQGDVPVLADNRFSTQQEYDTYLAKQTDPAAFIDEELRYTADRFTFYSEDYKELANFSSGISKSNGLEFGLSLISDSDNVFGFVQYIVKNSDASTKDIKRGDLFTGVNGVQLNRNNYYDLLFDGDDTYTLNMATIENNTISPNGKEVTLTKSANLEEDPILVQKVITQGDKKIAYLMYNQFIPGSGEALNQVFGEFKSAGVNELILDLRYNVGGRGTTADILASLIYGTDTSKLIYRIRYNDKVQAQFADGELDNNFVETTGTFYGNSNAPLNTLNLSKVYILATGSTASASELVMVGLQPYMNVVHIGTTTVGKNQGSILFVDDIENSNFYDPEREDKINPNNHWGIQPIVSRVENSAGFSDYADGLLPTIELKEDITNLGTLGDINEPLLARAIQEIMGTGAKRSFDVHMPANLITSSKLFDDRNSTLLLNKHGLENNNLMTNIK